MTNEEMSLLFKGMSELLDNQLSIMKHIGLINDNSDWGDGCDSIRDLSRKLYEIGMKNESKYGF